MMNVSTYQVHAFMLLSGNILPSIFFCAFKIYISVYFASAQYMYCTNVCIVYWLIGHAVQLRWWVGVVCVPLPAQADCRYRLRAFSSPSKVGSWSPTHPESITCFGLKSRKTGPYLHHQCEGHDSVTHCKHGLLAHHTLHPHAAGSSRQ